MAPSASSYPHPVIGNRDDVDSSFEINNVTFTPTVEDVEVKFRVRLDDEELRCAVADEKAALTARWSCAATLSSGDLQPVTTHQHHDGATYVAWLDQRQIRDGVRIDIQIVAKDDIAAYRLSRQHPDYGEQTFRVQRGDVLADGGWFEISADKLYDPMQPPLSSCFKILRDDRARKRISVDFSDDEHVLIRLSDEMASGLGALAHLPKVQLAFVVLPALLETLNFIERTRGDAQAEDLSGKAWVRTIEELAAGFGSDASNLVIAQRILEDPLQDCLTVPLVIAEEED